MARRLAPRRNPFGRAAAGTNRLAATSSNDRDTFARPSEECPLNIEFLPQALIDVTAAVRDDRGEQAGLGMAAVVPAGISGDRVPADAADVGAPAHRVAHLVGHIMEPRRLG